MQFNDFIQWVFYGLLSGTFIIGVRILDRLGESVDSLNEKIAIILEKVSWHEKTLGEHNERIKDLEKKG